jgi:hypothetical protein
MKREVYVQQEIIQFMTVEVDIPQDLITSGSCESKDTILDLICIATEGGQWTDDEVRHFDYEIQS